MALVLTSACYSCSKSKLPYANVATANLPPASANVLVDFDSAASADRPLLLYSGTRANTCQSFEAHVGDGTPLVKLVGMSWNPACAVEVAVFVPGHGAFGRAVNPNVPADVKWITDAISSGGLPLAYPPLLHLPIQLWLLAEPDRLVAARLSRNLQVSNALSIFEGLATGITLDTSTVEISGKTFGHTCESADAISQRADIYDASKINVYFVDASPVLWGANCWMKAHPEIIFVSWSTVSAPVVSLAHEIGHALGLVHPKVAPTVINSGGHTNDLPEFQEHDFNLMLSGGNAVTNVSVGQLYAMNFSADSWRNRVGSPYSAPVVRTCQDSWSAGACPALTRFQPDWPVLQAGWPPP